MAKLTDLSKRLFIGRPVRSDALGETLLPKRLALPIFASDPLSSVAYATQEVLVVLTLGGLAYLYLTPYLALGVFSLLVVVVLSYRQLVHAYPSGGGDYEVASKNLGRPAGLTVASALLIDYVLTVAVSRLGRRRQHHLGVRRAQPPPGAASRSGSWRCSPR